MASPLNDPRVLIAARRALEYRTANGITVEAGTTRMSLKLGGKAAARTADGRHLSSEQAVELEDVRRTEASGGGWAELVGGRAALTAA